jgi:hypothetical protein
MGAAVLQETFAEVSSGIQKVIMGTAPGVSLGLPRRDSWASFVGRGAGPMDDVGQLAVWCSEEREKERKDFSFLLFPFPRNGVNFYRYKTISP